MWNLPDILLIGYTKHESFLPAAVTAVFVPNTYSVAENVAGGNLDNVCVAIISPVATTLSATSQVTVTFADGTASSQRKYSNTTIGFMIIVYNCHSF